MKHIYENESTKKFSVSGVASACNLKKSQADYEMKEMHKDGILVKYSDVTDLRKKEYGRSDTFVQVFLES
jgi:tmRNA-binding protein